MIGLCCNRHGGNDGKRIGVGCGAANGSCLADACDSLSSVGQIWVPDCGSALCASGRHPRHRYLVRGVVKIGALQATPGERV